jgi:hypothetical protein
VDLISTAHAFPWLSKMYRNLFIGKNSMGDLDVALLALHKNIAFGTFLDVARIPTAGHGCGSPAVFGEGELVAAGVAVAGGFFKDMVELVFSHRGIIDEVGDPSLRSRMTLVGIGDPHSWLRDQDDNDAGGGAG